uniref:Putative zinc finger protein n=1 Tax=Schistosoma mansoni TaxID=6183 RepID=A0A3Q0KMC4_SCHMA
MIKELSASDDESEPLKIESLCTRCLQNGTTILMLTKISYFKEVVISSFSCPHCGYENRSLMPASQIQDKGQRITLKVNNVKDMNRRVVIPVGSTVSIPEYDSSFPFSDGVVSTIEGIITGFVDNLNSLQPERKESQPDLALKIEKFIEQLRTLIKVDKPFSLVIDDPSGNGFIENYLAPNDDPQIEIETYVRTPEQNELLGLQAQPVEEVDNSSDSKTIQKESNSETSKIEKDEVMSLNVNCPSCNTLTENKMKVVDIPHFKEVILMAINCPVCGFRDCEVKSGGGVSPKGRHYKLRITNIYDLSRDILVSETAAVKIPELDFESMGGTLGGRFTTIEGLLVAITKQLVSTNPFIVGDSSSAEETAGRLGSIINEIKEITSGNKLNILFELNDPAGNSYIQNLYAPDPDPELEMIEYERSEEENEFLGLTDMKTEDYETTDT